MIFFFKTCILRWNFRLKRDEWPHTRMLQQKIVRVNQFKSDWINIIQDSVLIFYCNLIYFDMSKYIGISNNQWYILWIDIFGYIEKKYTLQYIDILWNIILWDISKIIEIFRKFWYIISQYIVIYRKFDISKYIKSWYIAIYRNISRLIPIYRNISDQFRDFC